VRSRWLLTCAVVVLLDTVLSLICVAFLWLAYLGWRDHTMSFLMFGVCYSSGILAGSVAVASITIWAVVFLVLAHKELG